MQVPAQTVYDQIVADGGSTLQGLVGASLVSGIESDGDPLELAGGIGPAQGLFQFEPGTWKDNGGGSNGIPSTVGAATWQQQVQVFVNASKGNNFGAWGPDLGGGYGYSGPPKAGSAVANKIAQNGAAWAKNVADPTGEIGQIEQAATGAGAAVANYATGGLFGDASGAVSSVGGLITDITSRSFWQRIGEFALGAALIIGGLVLFVATSKPGEDATKVAALAAA